MQAITDEAMRAMLPLARQYAVVILKSGPQWGQPGTDKTIWEHGRRNFALRAEGILAVVCPIRDESEVHGVGIFNGSVEEITTIMDGDPAVQAGIFIYELHPCRGFPGDHLPE